jgi:hypothetical protein
MDFTLEQVATALTSTFTMSAIGKWLWDRYWKRRDEAEKLAREASAEAQRKKDEEMKLAQAQAHEAKSRAEAEAQNRRDAEQQAIKNGIHEIGNEMRNAFSEIRGLINQQGLSIRESQLEVGFMKERMEKAEVFMANVPKMIEDSRHTLRSELQAMIFKAAKDD